jgi:hypothetical protein
LADGWRLVAERPAYGRKIIALFDDGSGANLFFTHEDGLIDAEGTEYGWTYLEDSHIEWTYLPDGFRLWCEDRDEDPFTFPAATAKPAPVGDDRGTARELKAEGRTNG